MRVIADFRASDCGLEIGEDTVNSEVMHRGAKREQAVWGEHSLQSQHLQASDVPQATGHGRGSLLGQVVVAETSPTSASQQHPS